jgi:WD40 repeat protein
MNESQLKKPLATLEGFCGIVTSLAFSTDTRWLASGAANGLVTLWNIASRTAIKTFEGHSESVDTVAFSFDGKTLLSGAADGVLRAWDLDSANQIWADEDFVGRPCSALFVPFTDNLLWLAQDNTLNRCHPRVNGIPSRIPILPLSKEPVTSIAFSPDGQTIASGSYDGTVKLWEVSAGKLLRTLSGNSLHVLSVAFSPDGQTFASGSGDRKVKLWEVGTCKLLRTLSGHSDYVTSVAFSPNGQTVASGSHDRTVKLWEVGTKLLRTLSGHSDYVTSVAFSPDGQTITSGSRDRTVKLWEVSAGKLLRTLSGHSDYVTSVAFSPDGQTIASGSKDSTTKLWKTSTGKLLQTLSGHSGSVTSIAFSPAGETIVSGSNDGSLKRWRLDSGEMSPITREVQEEIVAIASGPDDQRVLAADKKGRLWFIELTPDGKEHLVCHTDFIDDVRVSQGLNGRYALLTSEVKTTILLVDLATGQPARSFVGHKKAVLSAALSPDEAFLVSGGKDRAIHLWRVSSGELVRTLRAHTADVRAVTFSPDGRYIASGGDDQTIKLWQGTDPGGAATIQPVVSPSRRGLPTTLPDSPPPSLAIPGATQELLDVMRVQIDTHERRVAKLEFLVEKLFRLLDSQGKAPSEDAVIIQRKSFDDF